MRVTRRAFGQVLGSSAATALAWEVARAQVEDTGEVSAETVRVLLDAQGPRGIYDDPEQLELLRTAVANMIRVQAELRAFPLDSDEQPALVFRRH